MGRCGYWSSRTTPRWPTGSPRGCATPGWPSTSSTTALRRSTRAADIAYDVIVLDRDLPDVHGDRVCRTLAAPARRPGS